MAGDRFIYFGKRAPGPGHVRQILGNFFGACGTIESHPRVTPDRPGEAIKEWWFVKLPGKNSAPFAGLPDSRPSQQQDLYGDEDRCIEVVLQMTDEGLALDVMTRHGDPFTSGLARRLTDDIARFYGGRTQI